MEPFVARVRLCYKQGAPDGAKGELDFRFYQIKIGVELLMSSKQVQILTYSLFFDILIGRV